MFTDTFTFTLSMLLNIIKILGKAYKNRFISYTETTCTVNLSADELLKLALEDRNFSIHYHIVENRVQILELNDEISGYTYYILKIGDNKFQHFVKLVNEKYLDEERINGRYQFYQNLNVNEHVISHYCNEKGRNYLRSNNEVNNSIVFYDTPKEYKLTIVNSHDNIVNNEIFTDFSIANTIYSSYKGKSYSPSNRKRPITTKKRRLMFMDNDNHLLKIKYLD